MQKMLKINMKLFLVIIKDSWSFQVKVAGNGEAFLTSLFVCVLEGNENTRSECTGMAKST
jgi:hypothetical protein